jgi:hypothetical protein
LFEKYIYAEYSEDTFSRIANLYFTEPADRAELIDNIVLSYANKIGDKKDLTNRIAIWMEYDRLDKQEINNYTKKWAPIVFKIAVTNSAMKEKIEKLYTGSEHKKYRLLFKQVENFKNINSFNKYDDEMKTEIKNYINDYVFKYTETGPESDLKRIVRFYKDYLKAKNKVDATSEKIKGDIKEVNKDNKISVVDNNLLKKIIKEQLLESKLENYSNYPYVSSDGDLTHPTEDFVDE